jgi:uncharacterized protein (TIGR00299 family) protein
MMIGDRATLSSVRIGYLDMFSGVSGDMLLGACLDAGVELGQLEAALASLTLDGVELKTEVVSRHGINATLCHVDVPDRVEQRSLPEIIERIENAKLGAPVTDRAQQVFERLGQAEAKVHGTTLDEVHFHEVGALDAIVDIVGTVWCLQSLGVGLLHASPFTLGSGWTGSSHGRLPLPPPAVMELVRGWQVRESAVQAELTTPTGAALVTTLASAQGLPPDFVPDHVGYGAGTREFDEQPNLLRLIIGNSREPAQQLALVECDLDDLEPRFFGPLADRLYGVGAVEVHWVPVQMKKRRPGVTVRLLAPHEAVDATTEVLFNETTTLGVRYWNVARHTLARESIEVETSFGRVAVKRVRRRDGRVELRPEFDACRAIAEARGVAVRDVVAALTAELARLEPDPDLAV